MEETGNRFQIYVCRRPTLFQTTQGYEYWIWCQNATSRPGAKKHHHHPTNQFDLTYNMHSVSGNGGCKNTDDTFPQKTYRIFPSENAIRIILSYKIKQTWMFWLLLESLEKKLTVRRSSLSRICRLVLHWNSCIPHPLYKTTTFVSIAWHVEFDKTFNMILEENIFGYTYAFCKICWQGSLWFVLWNRSKLAFSWSLTRKNALVSFLDNRTRGGFKDCRREMGWAVRQK